MAQYNTPEDLLDQIAALEKRVRTLETVANLHAASIDAGDLTVQAGGSLVVKNNNGTNLLQVGRDDNTAHNLPDGSKQSDFFLRRQDGSTAMVLYDPVPAVDGFNQFWALYDRAGDIIFGDDTTSGQGLARPYIPIPFVDWVNYPVATTTNATFSALMVANTYKQHPRMYLTFFTRSSDGTTTGEVQLWDDNAQVQIGDIYPVTAGEYQFNQLTFSLTGTHMSNQAIHLRGRRISGSGTIGVKVLQAYGIQS